MIKASPASSICISVPKSEMSCLAEDFTMFLSLSSASPRMNRVLNCDNSSSSISFGCWVMAQSPVLNFLPSLDIWAKMFTSDLPFWESTLCASSITMMVGISFLNRWGS